MFRYWIVVYPACPLPTTASPILQGAMMDGFGDAVVVCDMPELCKFPFLDSGQKMLPRAHKDAELAKHPVVGLVLHAGDAKTFPHAWFRTPGSFSRSQQAGSNVSQP